MNQPPLPSFPKGLPEVEDEETALEVYRAWAEGWDVDDHQIAQCVVWLFGTRYKLEYRNILAYFNEKNLTL